jgi:hypothetical protein
MLVANTARLYCDPIFQSVKNFTDLLAPGAYYEGGHVQTGRGWSLRKGPPRW